LSSKALVATLFALSTIGCGAQFDPQSELQTLRILAVQKDKPYAKPGDDVEMRMLWHDGSPDAPRPVQVAWFSGCFNPPGDLYAGCIDVLAQGSGPGGLPPGSQVGAGNTFTFTMPDDVISGRPPPTDTRQPPYGLSYVFFAVCAGTLGPAPENAEFPFACRDADGDALGSDDFVAGYSAIYAYDNYANANPIVTGFMVNGKQVTPGCIGDECLTYTPPTDLDCNSPDVACVPSCEDDGELDCPDQSIEPIIDPASAEVDQVSQDAYQEAFQEQMWVRYYVTRGGVKSDVRLLNDAKKGWNDDYGTKFWAPKEKGPVSVWAVAHDNRGGVSWVRQEIGVQ
jgi:hypothetical protein